MRGAASWPLFLYGSPGTGKTCAALALLDYFQPWQQRFAEVGDLVNDVMATFGTGERFDWRRFGGYREEPNGNANSPSGKSGALLVVLDELGAREKITDTHYECVKKVLDLRTTAHPLILISNHDLAGIARIYDARIASRCEAGSVFHLAGKDRRTTGG